MELRVPPIASFLTKNTYMELIVIILIGIAIYAMIAAPIKRSKHRAKYPCGTECNASPWGTSTCFEANHKCPKCGHKFTTHYSKL